MLPPAVFGIKSSGLNLAANLTILFLVVIWLALVYWTYADARRRISDPMLIGCATAASLFPFVGTLVYLIVRPPEYLDDVRERELEMQAAEARLAELGYHLCPYCDHEIETDFLRCPSCMRKLKEPCRTCGKPLDPNWKICPFCEAEVTSVAAAPRRTRRRRETSSELREPAAEPRAARREPPRDTAERRSVVREAAERPDTRRETAAERRETLREAGAEEPQTT
jgi:hypothetical protein